MTKKLLAFLRERSAFGKGEGKPRMIEGGASFAYSLGSVLAVLLVVEALTGIALAAFYSPSTTNAWASVAYIEDQSTWGWLVRGLHHHGGSALVVIAGLHLVQTAVAGAYKRPRELVWWLGVLLLVLVLGWAVTGYVLRWDQAGYWANRVEVGIAAGTPLVGGKIRDLALGGNEYGNLTLTRFYALHVLLLPAIVTLVTIAHVVLARRHGTTPIRTGAATPRWPYQGVRDSIAVAVAFAILLGFVVSSHGIGLAAPADPTAAYDARPLWYFRWLFELREIAGSAELFAALAAPAIVGGFLVALPLLDRGPDRSIGARAPWLGGLAGMLALIAALTVTSLARDAGDDELAKRRADAELGAHRARYLAKTYGVPATGPGDLWTLAPMAKGRRLFEARCKECHDDGSSERKGPVIGPGHGNRAWFAAFLKDPSNDRFWGRTKLAKREEAMKPVDLPAPEIEALAEMLYAESGATGIDAAKREHGVKLFESACTDCHSLEDGVAGASAPNLHGLGSRDQLTRFISNPKAPIHMGPDNSEMPRFDRELTLVERDAIAEYLVWLRSATAADLGKLGPPP